MLSCRDCTWKNIVIILLQSLAKDKVYALCVEWLLVLILQCVQCVQCTLWRSTWFNEIHSDSDSVHVLFIQWDTYGWDGEMVARKGTRRGKTWKKQAKATKENLTAGHLIVIICIWNYYDRNERNAQKEKYMKSMNSWRKGHVHYSDVRVIT